MSCTDFSLDKLMQIHIDRIPLDLACRLLPISTRLSTRNSSSITAWSGCKDWSLATSCRCAMTGPKGTYHEQLAELLLVLPQVTHQLEG
jgi:hypothetical protein